MRRDLTNKQQLIQKVLLTKMQKLSCTHNDSTLFFRKNNQWKLCETIVFLFQFATFR